MLVVNETWQKTQGRVGSGVPNESCLFCFRAMDSMSAAEFSVLFRPLQKSITEQRTELIAMLPSNSVRKSNVRLQINEKIGTSFQLEMISEFL